MTQQFSPKRIRNWTLYVVKLNANKYYVGITSRADFMRRIRQHGTGSGARWNRNRKVEEVIEIQHLGKMTALRAENIENDVTIEYMKKYGRHNVRGGRNLQKSPIMLLTHNPGSTGAWVQIVFALLIALLLLIIIIKF